MQCMETRKENIELKNHLDKHNAELGALLKVHMNEYRQKLTIWFQKAQDITIRNGFQIDNLVNCGSKCSYELETKTNIALATHLNLDGVSYSQAKTCKEY